MGGKGDGSGTLFQLTPSGDTWTLNTQYQFDRKDGAFPVGLLLRNGKL